MALLKFLKLSLLSNKERRGLQIDLARAATVLQAGNGYGKSAILKSLYDTLGATPPKIDPPWRDAKVTSLLEFDLDGRQYSALKQGNRYIIMDHVKNVLINTTHVTAELGPFLANLTSFRLVLTDRKGETRIPPPSFMFTPYYVDQDASWQKPWAPFLNMGMFPRVSKPLSEYHSGVRPNLYYEAKARSDILKASLAKIELERAAVTQALAKLAEAMPGATLSVGLEDFTEETDILVVQGQSLHDAQVKYRNELGSLNEEFHLWHQQVAVIEASLMELDSSFKEALGEPSDVECPMCGQHYHNNIAEQFEIISDKDDLVHALQTAREKLRDVGEKLNAQRLKLHGVESEIEKINRVLAVERQSVSLHDVVVAQGRSEAHKILAERTAELDKGAGETQGLIAQAAQEMKDTERPKRKQEILLYFNGQLEEFAAELDFRLPGKMRDPLQGLQIGRGSVGPRAMAAYYYAFLYTIKKYGTAAFCPIVVDAPNQQGQDKGHLEQIMTFLIQKRPNDSQVVIGTEAIALAHDAKVIDVANVKESVMKAEEYEGTAAYLRPFLQQAIL